MKKKISLSDYDILTHTFNQLNIEYDLIDKEDLEKPIKNADISVGLDGLLYFYFDHTGKFLDYG